MPRTTRLDLYLSKLDGSPAKTIDHAEGTSASARIFRRTAAKIAFLYVEGATRPAGALAAMKPPSGVIGEDGVEIQRVASGACGCRAACGPNACDPGQPACVRVRLGAGFEGAGLYCRRAARREQLVGGASYTAETIGSQPKSVLAPAEVSGPLHGLQIAVPRWSPDGKTIAFIGGSDERPGFDGRRRLDCFGGDGGQPRDISQGRPTSPAWIEWGERRTSVCERAGGRQQPVDSLSSDVAIAPAMGHNFWLADFQYSRKCGRWSDGDEPFFNGGRFHVRLRRQHLRTSREDLCGQAGHGDDVGPRRRDAAFALQ